jgi:hypothetical protein
MLLKSSETTILFRIKNISRRYSLSEIEFRLLTCMTHNLESDSYTTLMHAAVFSSSAAAETFLPDLQLLRSVVFVSNWSYISLIICLFSPIIF